MYDESACAIRGGWEAGCSEGWWESHGAPGIGCQEADGYIGAWHARGGRGGSEGRAACGLLTTWCREENLSTADPEVAKKEVAKKEGCQETVLGLGNNLLLGQGMENPRTFYAK